MAFYIGAHFLLVFFVRYYLTCKIPPYKNYLTFWEWKETVFSWIADFATLENLLLTAKVLRLLKVLEGLLLPIIFHRVAVPYLSLDLLKKRWRVIFSVKRWDKWVSERVAETDPAAFALSYIFPPCVENFNKTISKVFENRWVWAQFIQLGFGLWFQFYPIV